MQPPRPMRSPRVPFSPILFVSLLFVVGCLWGPVQALAQEAPGGFLTGRVVEDETGDPLDGATVTLWQISGGDSTMVAGTATDSDGRFSFEEVAMEPYLLRVSYVGYTTKYLPDVTPASDSSEGDLGTIRLVPEPTEAEGVEVTADRPAAQIETDRTIYNTSDRAVSTGGSARTVLETIPSVRVDIDGSISFRGNESVSLHINGEPASLSGESLVSYLQSLPAEAVKRVETIPNPSAKYEPEGMAGIINIVLEHDLNAGWNGGVTLGAERDANARYGGNGSVTAGYQGGGWRITANYSHRRDSEEDTDSRLVEQFNGNGLNTWINQQGLQEEQDRSHSLNTQLEYNFSENTSLGLETTLSLRGDQQSGNTKFWEYRGNASPKGLQDHYVRTVNNSSSDQTIDGRLNFDHNFTEEHTLSAQVQYDRDFESQDGTYTTYGLEDGTRTFRNEEREIVNEDEQDGSLEIDYTRPLGPLSMEAGYKGTLRRLDSDQTYQGNETVFTFDETIHAAYGILKKELGDFELETGLRTETVHTTFDLSSENEVTNSSYVSFYPSAFLTYKPSRRQQARLSYSKRVDRPSLWDINPIENNQNPTFREEGNPGLDPEYIHSFELSATQRWDVASVTVTPYVRHTVNQIEQVRREETNENGETVIVRRAENLSSSTSYGTELVTTFNYGKWLEGTLSGNLYRSVTDGSNLTTDLSQDALLFSSRANLRAELQEGLQFELSQFYRPAREIPPQGRMDRFMSTELALKKSIFGGDGSLTLRVDDLFNDTRMSMWYRDQDIYQESRFQRGAREVSLTFQYSFGSGGEEQDDRGDRRGRGGPR